MFDRDIQERIAVALEILAKSVKSAVKSADTSEDRVKGSGAYGDFAVWHIDCEMYDEEGSGCFYDFYIITDDTSSFPDVHKAYPDRHVLLKSITLYALVKHSEKIPLPSIYDELNDQTTRQAMRQRGSP
jgi:hypothetical protein